MCSQHAIIISEILKAKGIESKIIGLDGHVVATALVNKTNNQWWILDPDYGVIVPHDIKQVEENPSIIQGYYSSAGYSIKTNGKIINIYEKSGNKIIDGVRKYDPRIKSYALRYYVESITYFLKWVMPLLFIFPFLFDLLKKRNKKARSGSC